MKICTLCKRQAHGFEWIKPPLYASDLRNRKMIKHFCSIKCQQIFNNLFKQTNMIDLTVIEKEAIESALKPVGEYLTEIGINKPLAEYSREEVLCLIEVALSAYFDFMQGKEAEAEMSEVIPC
jgi:hypothetical protein